MILNQEYHLQATLWRRSNWCGAGFMSFSKNSMWWRNCSLTKLRTTLHLYVVNIHSKSNDFRVLHCETEVWCSCFMHLKVYVAGVTSLKPIQVRSKFGLCTSSRNRVQHLDTISELTRCNTSFCSLNPTLKMNHPFYTYRLSLKGKRLKQLLIKSNFSS